MYSDENISRAKDHVLLPVPQFETRQHREEKRKCDEVVTLCIHDVNSHKEICRNWLDTIPGAEYISGLDFWHLLCFEHASEDHKNV